MKNKTTKLYKSILIPILGPTYKAIFEEDEGGDIWVTSFRKLDSSTQRGFEPMTEDEFEFWIDGDLEEYKEITQEAFII